MDDAVIRPYRPADHAAGRRLWGELTRQHRELYDEPGVVGGDRDATFDGYLTRLELSGVWVAEHHQAGVVGLAGLVLVGRSARVEPVVVTERHRGRGIGRSLLGHVAGQARRRGISRLTVAPEARNVSALRCLHAAGYDLLSAVELTLDLRAPATGRDRPTIDLHELHFRS
ncbi:GNAT family N-acetyltransferase [Micromonospora echinofusca]|uniref:GNAT family N-acetyltransferase n=1 Tax=Micromonospora echinofusca TaxID=47858 RepID=A0ABS3VZ02_MICEH|nr:GNAT family N-acetyltransferase [Micromonospora echinofusca]MBO4209738.1 GNAT family N-acetyltransferase [Micromonospora echinofusca]